MPRRRAKMGVPAFDEKIFISEQLLGAYSQRELADLVYPSDSLAALSAYGNFRKWRKVMPTRSDGPKDFFDALASALNCKTVTGRMLAEANIQQFIGYLPPDRQDDAKAALELFRAQRLQGDDPAPIPVPASTGRTRRGARFRSMNYLRDGKIPSLRDGIQAGRINQEHYYLYVDAATTWHKLVRAEAYPTYDQCKSGLQKLVDDPAWQEALAASQPTSVIMLGGGGAPTKDLVLINNLLQQPHLADKSLTYFIVDVSSYMLKASILWLNESLQEISGAERVEVVEQWHDMLELNGCEDAYRDDGAAVFAITGGTIGNVSERAFFHSIGSISRPGDLLIISADTVEDAPSQTEEAALVKKYNHPGMRRFIAPSVHALIGELDLPESADAIFKRLKITVAPARSAGLSDVDDSYAVTLSVEAKGRDVTLLSSTRYRAERLQEFAAAFGWRPLTVAPSPRNPQFKQFLFRRELETESGTSAAAA